MRTDAAGSLSGIRARGVLTVGTTADYWPLSGIDAATGAYAGFDIELAREIAGALGVSVRFVRTSWPTLMEDLAGGLFDCALSGISVTDARKACANLSDGYLRSGKTILCRAGEAERFHSLADVDRGDITVMVNPGGTNAQFARERLARCRCLLHARNAEIPALIRQGKADVMITETVEARYYIARDAGLAAPLIAEPFTDSRIGVLIPKAGTDLLAAVNTCLRQQAASGRLARLAHRYGIDEACLGLIG